MILVKRLLNKPLIWAIVAFILILSAIYANKNALLRHYALSFELDNRQDSALYDYIVILGGNPLVRTNKAVELYRLNIAKSMLITQPRDYTINDFGGALQSEFAQISLALTSLKIPFLIATNPQGATSTYDEALDIARFLGANPAKSILIVTDKFHTKRAFKTFQAAFEAHGIPTEIYITGANSPYYDENNWWRTEAGLREYIVESGIWLLHSFNYQKPSTIAEH